MRTEVVNSSCGEDGLPESGLSGEPGRAVVHSKDDFQTCKPTLKVLRTEGIANACVQGAAAILGEQRATATCKGSNISWLDWLPVDQAVIMHTTTTEPLSPFDHWRFRRPWVLNRFGDFDCSGPQTFTDGRSSISGAAYL